MFLYAYVDITFNKWNISGEVCEVVWIEIEIISNQILLKKWFSDPVWEGMEFVWECSFKSDGVGRI